MSRDHNRTPSDNIREQIDAMLRRCDELERQQRKIVIAREDALWRVTMSPEVIRHEVGVMTAQVRTLRRSIDSME